MTLRKNDNRGGEEIDTETSINLKERKRKEAKDKINSSSLKLDKNERKGREKNRLLSSFISSLSFNLFFFHSTVLIFKKLGLSLQW